MLRNISKYIFNAILLFILWIFLTWNFRKGELIVGAALSLTIALFTYRSFSYGGLLNFHPKKIFCLFLYIPFFLKEMVKANFDVAYRVLHPKMPIRPGIVRVKTRMKSSEGKTAVANSITLTPGTLTLDIIGDNMLIHWINVKTTDVEEASREIPQRFEKCIKEFLS